MKHSIIGQNVNVTMDRPIGAVHPKHPDIVYPINYGYIEGLMGGDGEEQDVYVLGPTEPTGHVPTPKKRSQKPFGFRSNTTKAPFTRSKYPVSPHSDRSSRSSTRWCSRDSGAGSTPADCALRGSNRSG